MNYLKKIFRVCLSHLTILCLYLSPLGGLTVSGQALALAERDEGYFSEREVRDQEDPENSYRRHTPESYRNAETELEDIEGEIRVASEKAELKREKTDHTSKILEYLVPMSAMFMGGAVIGRCRDQISAWVFGGVAGIWLIAKAMSWGNYQKESDLAMEAERDPHDEEKNQDQVKELRRAAKQTHLAADAVERDAKHTKYASIGFGAAAVMALGEGALRGPKATCGHAKNEPIPSNPSPSTDTPISTTSLELFPGSFSSFNERKEEISQATFAFTFTDYYQRIISETTSYDQGLQVLSNWMAHKHGAKESFDFTSLNFESSYETSHDLEIVKSSFSFLISSFTQLLTPSAEAFIGGLFGGGKDDDKDDDGIEVEKVSLLKDKNVQQAGLGAVAGIGGFLLASRTELLKFVDNPWMRAAAFGGIAGLTYWLSTQLDKDGEALRNNAEKYEELADILEKSTENGGIETPRPGHNVTPLGPGVNLNNLGLKNPRDISSPRNGKGVCQKMDGTVDEDCACLGNNNCRKSTIPTEHNLAGFNPPAFFNESLSSLNKTDNQLGHGDFAGANETMSANLGSANAMRAYRRHVQDGINQQREGQGGKKLDFDGMENDFKASLRRATKKDFHSMPPALQGQLASLTPSQHSPFENQLEQIAPDRAQVISLASEEQSKKTKKDPFKDFEWQNSFSEEQSARSPAAPIFDIDGSGRDVSGRSDQDLFQIISSRYIQSAFPIFFNRLEEDKSVKKHREK